MEKTAERYQGERGKLYHESKRHIPAAAWPWVSRVRALKIAPHVRTSDVVLEYGVGLGWNLAAVPCARRLGYDIGEFLAPSVEAQGIEFISDTRLLPDHSVNAVICHHVLEHVLNPSAVLVELRRLLQPGGRLLAFVPYEKERRYWNFRRDEPNHHLYSWNVQTLANLIEETGFEVLYGQVAMFSYDRFSAVSAVRLRLGERGYRLIRQMVHRLHPCLEVRVFAQTLP